MTGTALEEVFEAFGSTPMVFRERDALKLVDPVLKRLKESPGEEQLAFVFEAIHVMTRSGSLGASLALKGMVASLLRSACSARVFLIEPSSARWCRCPGRRR
jgi:hypothetical protein